MKQNVFFLEALVDAKCPNPSCSMATDILKLHVSPFIFETNVCCCAFVLFFLCLTFSWRKHDMRLDGEQKTHPQPSAPEMGTIRELVWCHEAEA